MENIKYMNKAELLRAIYELLELDDALDEVRKEEISRMTVPELQGYYESIIGVEAAEIEKEMEETRQIFESNVKEIADENDMVNHPAHYAAGREIEPWDAIADWDLDFDKGSAVKYIARAGRKDDEIEDLEKAVAFLIHRIKYLTKLEGGTNEQNR